MQHHAHIPNNRFAWLTPVQSTATSKGPWILTENQTHHFASTTDEQSRKITVDGLLTLLASVLNLDSAQSRYSKCNSWQSECQKYRLILNKCKGDNSRLFVQRKDDYYSRIELYNEEKLIIAFQEPVWPHLQHSSLSDIGWLDIPTHCLLSLENNTRRSNQVYSDVNNATAASEHRAA